MSSRACSDVIDHSIVLCIAKISTTRKMIMTIE